MERNRLNSDKNRNIGWLCGCKSICNFICWTILSRGVGNTRIGCLQIFAITIKSVIFIFGLLW